MDENPYRSPEFPNKPARFHRIRQAIDAMFMAECMIGGAFVAGLLAVNPLDHDLSGARFHATCTLLGAVAAAVLWKRFFRQKLPQ